MYEWKRARKRNAGLWALLLLALLPGAARSQPPGIRYQAEIRYTAHGVPHVKAKDFRGLGYGAGVAFAQENICVLAQDFVTLRGERSKHFGPEGRYRDPFADMLGGELTNLDSDAYHRYIYRGAVALQHEGAGSELRQLVDGFVRGYNRNLSERGSRGLPAACRGAAWVTHIDEADVYRRFHQTQLLGGSNMLMSSLVAAASPSGGSRDRASQHAAGRGLEPVGATPRAGAIGSNAIAFGRDAAAHGGGLHFANPHFPWLGNERLYQLHLTIPGEYDVMGAGLYGVPFPMIGFSRDVAWTATWATNALFVVRRLRLDGEDHYWVDGNRETLSRIEIEIPLADGRAPVRRSFRESRFGPLLDGSWFPNGRSFLAPFSGPLGFALTDPNAANGRSMEQWFRLGRSRSVVEMAAGLDALTGLPYSNIVAADRGGNALFANKLVTVNVPDDRIERCVEGLRAHTYWESFRVLITDGSQSRCGPVAEPDAAQPGILPATAMPALIRTDYVVQSNDSHWVAHGDPATFLSGFPAVVGDERTPRGERTRLAVEYARALQKDGGATPERVLKSFNAAHMFHAELLVDDLVAECRRQPRLWRWLPLPGWVDLSDACEILAAWDRTESVESVGAPLFRELLVRFPLDDPDAWRVPFDPIDPIGTPAGLRSGRAARVALADAAQFLTENGIALDAPLGEVQFTMRAGEKLPLAGGPRSFRNVQMTFKPGQGYSDPVEAGDSYIHAVALTDEGPSGYFVNSYAQSVDANSSHFADQTRLYSRDEWLPIRFSDAEIEADPAYRVLFLQEPE